MSGDQLNLDAIESRWCEGGWSVASPDVSALVAEVRRLRERDERVEAWLGDDALDACTCGHGLDEHNGLGCYARLSYTPLVTCDCALTDDRTHGDLARDNLRAVLDGR